MKVRFDELTVLSIQQFSDWDLVQSYKTCVFHIANNLSEDDKKTQIQRKEFEELKNALQTEIHARRISMNVSPSPNKTM